MIDYQTFHQIRQLCDQEHLSVAQIAAALHLDERTVSKWIDCKTYQPRNARSTRQQARSAQRHRGPTIGHASLHRPATAPTVAGGRLHRRLQHPQGLRAHGASTSTARFPHAPFCPRSMCPGGLGLGRLFAGGQHAAAAFLFCHGALLQPPDVCRVHPGSDARTLSGLPPACLRIL